MQHDFYTIWAIALEVTAKKVRKMGVFGLFRCHSTILQENSFSKLESNFFFVYNTYFREVESFSLELQPKKYSKMVFFGVLVMK